MSDPTNIHHPNATPSNQWAIAEPALSPSWPDLVTGVAEVRRAIDRVRR